MMSRNLSRRLERLEAELAPPSDEPVLTIVVTSSGQLDQIIEMRGTDTNSATFQKLRGVK